MEKELPENFPGIEGLERFGVDADACKFVWPTPAQLGEYEVQEDEDEDEEENDENSQTIIDGR